MLLLGCRAETAQQVYRDGKILHPLCKRIVVLLRKDRRRHKIDDLLALLHRLERSTDGDLRLAVADITADQTIHDLCALHIMLRLLDRTHLILGLLKREHLLELTLPDRIRPVYIAFLLLTDCIQLDQLSGDLLHRTLHTRPRAAPLLRAERVELRLFRITAGIFLDQIQLCCQNIQVRSLRIGDLHVILGRAADLHLLDTLIDTESMILMHDIVADVQVCKAADVLALIALVLLLFLLFRAKDVTLRDDRKRQQRILITAPHLAVADHHLAGLQLMLRILRVKAGDALIHDVLRQTLRSGARS